MAEMNSQVLGCHLATHRLGELYCESESVTEWESIALHSQRYVAEGSAVQSEYAIDSY